MQRQHVGLVTRETLSHEVAGSSMIYTMQTFESVLSELEILEILADVQETTMRRGVYLANHKQGRAATEEIRSAAAQLPSAMIQLVAGPAS